MNKMRLFHLNLLFAVVWKHCHHGLVGRPLAQRGFCQFLRVHRSGGGRTFLGNGDFCFRHTNGCSEGLSLLEMSTCPFVVPQRDIMIISDVLPVMVNDALLSSHPIIVDVSSPAEITSVFDAISYSKVQNEKPQSK